MCAAGPFVRLITSQNYTLSNATVLLCPSIQQSVVRRDIHNMYSTLSFLTHSMFKHRNVCNQCFYYSMCHQKIYILLSQLDICDKMQFWNGSQDLQLVWVADSIAPGFCQDWNGDMRGLCWDVGSPPGLSRDDRVTGLCCDNNRGLGVGCWITDP